MNGIYKELANAIIVQAVREFRPAYKRLKRHPNDAKARDRVREITEFFSSDRFEILSDLDGPSLLNRIMREIDKECME